MKLFLNILMAPIFIIISILINKLLYSLLGRFFFSSQSDKIAAKSIGLAPENRWLITSDPDGKNVSYIEHMGENAHKVIVDWSPTRQFVAMSLTGEPLGEDRQQVLFIGQNNENFPSIIVEGYGLETKWSPTGDNYFIVSINK